MPPGYGGRVALERGGRVGVLQSHLHCTSLVVLLMEQKLTHVLDSGDEISSSYSMLSTSVKIPGNTVYSPSAPSVRLSSPSISASVSMPSSVRGSLPSMLLFSGREATHSWTDTGDLLLSSLLRTTCREVDTSLADSPISDWTPAESRESCSPSHCLTVQSRPARPDTCWVKVNVVQQHNTLPTPHPTRPTTHNIDSSNYILYILYWNYKPYTPTRLSKPLDDVHTCVFFIGFRIIPNINPSKVIGFHSRRESQAVTVVDLQSIYPRLDIPESQTAFCQPCGAHVVQTRVEVPTLK